MTVRWRPGARSLRLEAITVFALVVVSGLAQAPAAAGAEAAAGVPRILEQDASLDNFADPPGYAPTPRNELGDVRKSGHGATTIILIPGLGFGADAFDPLTERWDEAFTSYAVSIAGFGGSAAPAAPPQGTSFGAQSWTNSNLRGLERLVEREHLDQVVLVGHWLTGTQLALRYALAHPDKVRGVVLLAGSARWIPAGRGTPPASIPLEVRVRQIDDNLAPKWFKTVTRETWDDNNFLPSDYAANPVIGLRLWREAARSPLHVWVRYLCEFFAQDVTVDLARLTTPTLLVEPGLEGHYVDGGNDYLGAYLRGSWLGAIPAGGPIRVVPLADARAVPWADQLDRIDEIVRGFAAENPPAASRESGR